MISSFGKDANVRQLFASSQLHLQDIRHGRERSML